MLPATRPTSTYLAYESLLHANKWAQEHATSTDPSTYVDTKREGLRKWAKSMFVPSEVQIKTQVQTIQYIYLYLWHTMINLHMHTTHTTIDNWKSRMFLGSMATRG